MASLAGAFCCRWLADIPGWLLIDDSRRVSITRAERTRMLACRPERPVRLTAAYAWSSPLTGQSKQHSTCSLRGAETGGDAGCWSVPLEAFVRVMGLTALMATHANTNLFQIRALLRQPLCIRQQIFYRYQDPCWHTTRSATG